ncbi:hypothetical protein [Plantibacter sp. ME-Dv--P-122b]|uniref:YxiG-like protein n=1 Tax=Plantibacter sp. ME-Dv--P-122b TaxID=3040300 RepID=UPI00254B3309|nr:hypothetical protein [Plantibacter sp. ME-Dv--P-122b]
MEIREMQAAFDDAFDQAVVFHGFTEYMRDYEMVVQIVSAPSTGIPMRSVRYLFVNCVQADVSTVLPPDLWARSLDDRLLELGTDVDGYVWGVREQGLYPGFELLPDSEIARSWSTSVGIPFHAVRMRSNAHDISLVFSHLRVTELAPGYAPFRVEPA